MHGQWPVTATIYKTDFFKTIGFNSDLVVFEDLEVAIKAIVTASNFKVFPAVDCYYRTDANYQIKYNSLEVKIKMINAFRVFVKSLATLISQNSGKQFKNEQIKSYLIESYKKIFRFQILENTEAFKKDNREIVHLLATLGFSDIETTVKFFFVDRVLLRFANLKGSGVSKIIKKIYK